MKCKRAQRFLDRYLDGELARDAFLSVEEHVNGCPDCGEYLKSARSTGRIIREAAQANHTDLILSDRAWDSFKESVNQKERLFNAGTLINCWRWLAFYPRPIWASAIAASALLVVFTTAGMVSYQGSKNIHPVVEYVDSPSSQVMVLMPEQSPVTVIWVFEKSDAQEG